MLGRIDAEEGLMPPDGVLLLSAADIFKKTDRAGGVPPVLYGMEVPGAMSAVLGLDDDGTFSISRATFPATDRRATGKTSGGRFATSSPSTRS